MLRCLSRVLSRVFSIVFPPCLAHTQEKELLEKKMQRLEKAKETEVAELKSKLDASQGEVKGQLQVKDAKISEVRDTDMSAKTRP